MMEKREKHLYYMSELKDYKIDSHDHDIRGWKLRDYDQRVVGKVDNLLVNKELGKVVYVDVEVDQSIIDVNHDPYAADTQTDFKEFINKEGENHIIIPIGLIDIYDKDKYVYTESINYQTFAETKRYRSGTEITRNYEHHVLGSYNRNDRRIDREDNLEKTKVKRDEDLERTRVDRDRELERTRTAYTDDDIRTSNAKRTVERDYRDRDIDRETEERIRREKEQLRSSSVDRKRPIDDHNRSMDYNDKHQGLHPERSLDEDDQWAHQDRNLEDTDTSERLDRNRRDAEFYDRKEFLRRERR